MSNSGKKTLILHIGLPKAGSTTFKTHIFPTLEEIDFPDCSKKLRSLDYPVSSTTDDVVELLKPYIENSKKSSIVFSEEGLFRAEAQRLRQITLEEMGDLVAATKVIFVIRRQGDFLPSLYAQTANRRVEAGFEDYVESFFKGSNRHLTNLIYESIVDSLISTFGNDAVHVTPMEALFDSVNKDARRRLALFMGVQSDALEAAFNAAKPANQRASSDGQKVTYKVKEPNLTDRGQAVRTAWNKTKYFLGPIRNVSWVESLRQSLKYRLMETQPRQNFHVTPERRVELTAAFAESNWRLAKKYGLEQELQRYGYFSNPSNEETEAN